MAKKSVIASAVVSIFTCASLVVPVAIATPETTRTNASSHRVTELPAIFTAPSQFQPLLGWNADYAPNTPADTTITEFTQQFPILEGIAQPAVDVTADLKNIVATIRKEYGGTVAVSISNGTHIYTAGDDAMLRTWSTIKVPLAIAALRKNPQLQALARSSITVSDNQATTALWNSLGGGSRAAKAVTGVLQEAGTTAHVSTSAWGASSMKPSQQAKFGARLRCLSRASTVRSLMGQIVPEQSYGLGRMKNTIFKGGWGPSEDSYVIRQFGSVSLPGGSVGVAFYVEPASGTYATAQEAADTIAKRLESLTTKVGYSVC